MNGTSKLFADLLMQANKVFLAIEEYVDSDEKQKGLYVDNLAVLNFYKDSKNNAVKAKMMGSLINEAMEVVHTAYNFYPVLNLEKDNERLVEILEKATTTMRQVAEDENKDLEQVEEIMGLVPVDTDEFGNITFSSVALDTMKRALNILTDKEEMKEIVKEILDSEIENPDSYDSVFEGHYQILQKTRTLRKKAPISLVNKEINLLLNKLAEKRKAKLQEVLEK